MELLDRAEERGRLTRPSVVYFLADRSERSSQIARFAKEASAVCPALAAAATAEWGPRPIVEKEVAYYGSSYDIFSSVKPGITGLWQASGRSDTDYARRVALDVQYVLNWSPWMDIWILFRTVSAVFFMKGAR